MTSQDLEYIIYKILIKTLEGFIHWRIQTKIKRLHPKSSHTFLLYSRKTVYDVWILQYRKRISKKYLDDLDDFQQDSEVHIQWTLYFMSGLLHSYYLEHRPNFFRSSEVIHYSKQVITHYTILDTAKLSSL